MRAPDSAKETLTQEVTRGRKLIWQGRDYLGSDAPDAFSSAFERALRASTLVATALLLSGCLVVPQHYVVPHANFKIQVPPGVSESEVLDLLEKDLIHRGYETHPNDWQSWGFLDEARLEAKKMEREYRRGPFRLRYAPELGLEYRALGRLHLHFYEDGQYNFTDAGFAEYSALSRAFENAGFPPASTDSLDVKNVREVHEPASFNARHTKPTTAARFKSNLFSLVGLVPYALIVMLPGFWWALRTVRERRWSKLKQFVVFAATCGLLFAPMPLPLSMFGPLLLLPFPFFIPLATGMWHALWLWLPASIFATSAIAAIVLAVVLRWEASRADT